MKGLRRTLLATVSLAALSANASAAEWDGLYVGLNAGVAWHKAEFADLGDSGGTQNGFPPGTFWSPNPTGGTIGGQIGYNWQSANIVYGVEADLNWVSGNSSATFPGPSVSASTNLDVLATVRGRIGLASPSTLVYVTGGVAFGHIQNAWGSTFIATPEYTSNSTRVGLALGAGIEYMLAPNKILRFEGLYADFGSWTVNGPPGIIGPYRSRFAHSVTVFRGGLNFKW